MSRPSCSTPIVKEVQVYDESRQFAGLVVGPPLAPPTQLNPIGLQRIRDRLLLVTDVRGYTEEMAPAVKNTVQTLLTQDIPALLAAVESGLADAAAAAAAENALPDGCRLCATVHAIYHELDDERRRGVTR